MFEGYGLLNNEPLVSVVVITYNSSAYVLETLNSIKEQTYRNIELFVSDDHSSDHTVDLCNNWLSKNNQRFVSSRIIISKINTGIAPNCNRGLKNVRGEWVKFIAGDDVMLPDNIKNNILYVNNNHEARFIFSDMELIDKNGDHLGYQKHRNQIMCGNSAIQLKELLKGECYLYAPSSFLHVNTLFKIGMYDEHFPYLEDYPLWIKAAQRNYRFFYNSKITVRYRLHGDSIWNSYENINNANMDFLSTLERFYKIILIRGALKNKMYIASYKHFIEYIIIKSRLNNVKSYKYIKYIRLLNPSYFRTTLLKITH